MVTWLHRHLSLTMLVIAMSIPFSIATVRAETPSLEAAVKATYLYKLAPFVVWPTDTSTRPFSICVVGTDPFGKVLDDAIVGQGLGERPIKIFRVETIGPRSVCDIAYLGGSQSQSVANGLRAIRGAPVLTVTDESETPGMIDFVLQNGRVRFRVDQDATENSGLSVSSKLLGLALSVRRSKER